MLTGLGAQDGAVRLGVVMGAFVTGLTGSSSVLDEMPYQLKALREYCAARNYVYVYRNKLLTNVVAAAWNLRNICRKLKTPKAIIARAKREPKLTSLTPELYEALYGEINEYIENNIIADEEILRQWTGLGFLDYQYLFRFRERSFEEYCELELPAKSLLPHGLYVDAIPGKVRYQTLFSSVLHLLLTAAKWPFILQEQCRDVGALLDCLLPEPEAFEVFVDGDNASAGPFISELESLLRNPRVRAVHAYLDAESTPLWEVLGANPKVDLIHVERVTHTKSLVDLSIVRDMTNLRAKDPKTWMILVSGDSDFSVLMHERGLAQDYAVVYRENSMSWGYLTRLSNAGIAAIPFFDLAAVEGARARQGAEAFAKALLTDAVREGKLADYTTQEAVEASLRERCTNGLDRTEVAQAVMELYPRLRMRPDSTAGVQVYFTEAENEHAVPAVV